MTLQDELRTQSGVAEALMAELGRQLPDATLTLGETGDALAGVLADDRVRVVTLTFSSGDRLDGALALVARPPFAETLERAASDELLVTASGLVLTAAATALAELVGEELEANPADEVDLDALTSEIGDAAVVVYPILDGDDIVALFAVTVDEDGASANGSANGTASHGNGAGQSHAAPLVLADVEMGVTAELGRCHMTVRELLSLTPGAIIDLDRSAGALVDVLVNGTLIARGEVVVIEEEFGIRISELVKDGASQS
jgi:flagellar motor switch protein FliN/FliY